MLANTLSGHVEGAARPGGEPGAVQEDAGIILQHGDRIASLIFDQELVGGLIDELPILGGQAGDRAANLGHVLLVHKVRTIRAATLDELGGGSRQDPLAARSKDAGPRAFEEGEVKAPRALLLLIFKTDPFMRVFRCLCHKGNASSGAQPVVRPVDWSSWLRTPTPPSLN